MSAGPSASRAPVAADPALARRLGARLDELGYTESALRRALGQPIRLGVRGLTEVARRRLDGEAPLPTLFRLLWLGVPVPRASADSALAPVAVDELANAGVVAPVEGTVAPLVAISPYAGLLVAHDQGRLASQQTDDVVAPVSASSTVCDRLTIRRRVAAALDLGTGSGVQALRAARHAERVTAVDVSPRAVAFTRLNAALNSVDNVDVREGSWFEPVGGERFELVVANLPYVVSPGQAVVYRDGGLPRDDLARHVLSAVPEHLAEDGFAHVFCNWIVPRGGEWREPVERWVDGKGCDALLVLHGRHDPLSYAALWNHPLDEEDVAAFADTLERWLAYYRGEGIEEIADGMVVLRRRPARTNFVRALEVPETPARPAGQHVRRLFSGFDLVRALAEPADVLELPVDLPAGAVVDVRWVTPGGAPGGARVRLPDAAGFSVRTTHAMAEVLRRCDGRTPLGALVAAVAGERGRPEAELAPDVAAEATRLLGLGFLVAPGRGS